MTSSGFGQLHISTLGVHQDVDQVYAAGLLEGWLSAGTAHAHHDNSFATNLIPSPMQAFDPCTCHR